MEKKFTIEIGYERERDFWQGDKIEKRMTFDITSDLDHTNIYTETIDHAKFIAKAIGSKYYMICRANDSWRENPVYMSPAVAKAKAARTKELKDKETARLEREKKAVARINAMPKTQVIFETETAGKKLVIKVKRSEAKLDEKGWGKKLEMDVDYEFVVMIDGKKENENGREHRLSDFTNYITSNGNVQKKKFMEYESDLAMFVDSVKDINETCNEIRRKFQSDWQD